MAPSTVFLVLCLTTKLQVIAYHEVGRGTLDTVLVHPREVFKAAFLARYDGRSPMSRGNYSIYDSRHGRDYRLDDVRDLASGHERAFSSRDEGVFVVHGARLDWRDVEPLETVFLTGGEHIFVVYRPWWPGYSKKVAAFQSHFDHEPSPSDLLGFRGNEPGALSAALDLREQLGGWNSGLWAIGTCAKRDELVEAARHGLDTSIHLAASLLQKAPIVLALDEGGLSALFVRLRPAILSPIGELCDALQLSDFDSVEAAEW